MNAIMQKLIGLLNSLMPDIDTSNVTEETNLMQDLGLDSVNMIMLAIEVEDLFGISLGDEFAPRTVGDLCEFISKAGGHA